mgnify:FL=1
MSQPERITERISRRRLLRFGYLAAGAAGATVVLEACGGGKSKKPSNPAETPIIGPSPTRTLEPSPNPTIVPTEAPTVEPTKPPLKKLSEAEFVPTDFPTALKSINDAYEIHKDANEIRALTDINPAIEHCEKGDPSRPAFKEVDMLTGCGNLTLITFYIYQQKNYPEFYQAAVDIANYYLTQRPENKSRFDEFLFPEIKDTSPFLEK